VITDVALVSFAAELSSGNLAMARSPERLHQYDFASNCAGANRLTSFAFADECARPILCCRWCSSRVMRITAHSRAGASRIIGKPFQQEELARKVRAALDEAGPRNLAH
jgi:hypothetical protein